MRLRSLLIGLLVVAAVLAAAAGAYWFWWAGQLERGIAQWRDQQRLRGYEVNFGGPAIDGFPLAHVARFDGPAVRAPDGVRWHGPPLTARAALWDPRTIEISFAGRHILERLGTGRFDSAVLDSEQAEAVLRLRSAGRLASAAATVEALEVLADPLGRLASGSLQLSLAVDDDAGAEEPPGLAFSFEASDLEIPAALAAPMDPTAERVLAVGRLVEPIPQTGTRLALSAWRDSGGALEMERIEVDWAPLAVSASGQLSLDEQLRPEGQLAARIAGLPELLDRLAAQGLMAADQVANTKLAIRAFSGEPDDKGRPVLTVPIILRAGLLSLGPLPLARISPVL